MEAEPRCRTRSVIGLLAALLFAASSPAADTRVTVSRAPLHVAPRASSRVVAVVPAGIRLSVGSCSTAWCTTSWNGAGAWVAKRDLDVSSSHAPKRTGKGYINSDGQRIPSLRPSPSGPPPGASAQCNDGSYSFSTHRRGTCSHHGGVRRWLLRPS
jgi:hypothetical protein